MIQNHKVFSDCGYRKFECNSFVATAIVGSAVVGAGATMYASSKASEAQTNSANQANATIERQNALTRADLQPYRQIGIDANTDLQSRLPFLTSPIEFDQAAIENTPGYKVQKQLGEKAIQNSAAKRGLGVSGAALKGAIAFNKDLNLSTYKDQFNLENTNRANAYDRLKGLIDVGENAAAQTGVIGNKAATSEAGNTVGAGNAQAASINAMGGAVNSAANSLGGYAMYKGLYGSGPSGGYPAGPETAFNTSNQYFAPAPYAT